MGNKKRIVLFPVKNKGAEILVDLNNKNVEWTFWEYWNTGLAKSHSVYPVTSYKTLEQTFWLTQYLLISAASSLLMCGWLISGTLWVACQTTKILSMSTCKLWYKYNKGPLEYRYLDMDTDMRKCRPCKGYRYWVTICTTCTSYNWFYWN